jgi:predicted polyphosphate/ATP-dependent NAD kinase
MLLPLYPSTHCQGGLVNPSAGLDGAENLSSTGIQSPDRPVRSEYSLYLLRCRGPH